MSTSNRVERTRAELKEALSERVSLLVAFGERYDAGEHFIAKSMAVALRVCLHHQGRSNALLQQLDLRGGRFYTAAPKPNSGRVPVGCGLVAMSFTMTTIWPRPISSDTPSSTEKRGRHCIVPAAVI